MPTTYGKIGDNKGGDPDILKLEATNKVRPLDNAVAEYRQHTIENPTDPDQVTMVVCPGPRSCPLCRKPADPKGDPYFPMSRRFAACVWDYNTNSIKVLIAGPQVFDEFKTAAKLGIEPSSCDWTIVKEGAKRLTKYQVVRHDVEPGPQITPEQLLDVAKYEAPDSVERIFEVLEQYGINYDTLPIPNFSLAEALAFVMPYTTHKGLTIEKLLETDASFANWLHGTKLEQGALGDPVFIALQVAMEGRGMVKPLDDALAALPESEAQPVPVQDVASSGIPPAAEPQDNQGDAEQIQPPASAGPWPSQPNPALPPPVEGQVRLIAPNGSHVNVPADSAEALLASGAGFVKPEPPVTPSAAEQPDANTPTKVIIGGQEVTLPRIEAVKLVSFGTAQYADEAPAEPESEPPKLPLPDEEVQIEIGGTAVPMAYAQASQLVDSGSATFVSMEVATAHQQSNERLQQKREDMADAQSVAAQAAHEQANPINVPAPAATDLPNVCPHCGKGYKSKGGLTQHINRDHAGAAAPAQSQPPAAAPAAPAGTPATLPAATNGGGDANSLERVKDKLARAPFARDYNMLLTMFKEETGKASVMEMSEPELQKLEARIDTEIAKASG